MRRDLTVEQKLEKEMASLRMRLMFLLKLCRHQQILLDPSGPSYRNKELMRFC